MSSNPKSASSGPAPLASPDDPTLQGEDNCTAARRHRKLFKRIIDSGAVAQSAQDANPDSAQEEREMQDAEEAGRSHARK